MGGYTPFNPGFSFDYEDEEEKRKRQLEEAEQTSLRQSMETEPTWDMPTADVGGRLPPPEMPEPVGAVPEGGDYIDRYEEALGRRPERPDPSTLRKILSVIGGTIAGGSPDVTRQLAGYGGYDEEMADWDEEMTGLGDVAEMRGERFEEDVKARGQDVTARGQDVTGRGQDIAAETAANSLTARLAELEQRRAEATSKEEQLEIDNELAQLQLELDQRKADTSQQRADIYGANVESLGTFREGRLEQLGEGGGATLSPTQQEALEEQALADVIAMNPAWEKFALFEGEKVDPQGMAGMLPGTRDYLPDWGADATPAADDPDYQEFMVALEAARNRRGLTAGLGDVPPLPQMPGPPEPGRPLSSRDR